MKDASNIFIQSTNNISLSFIILSFLIILVIVVLAIIIRFKKHKWKHLNNRNLMFVAALTGLIIGIIYSSLNHFDKATYNNLISYPWVWEVISFAYSFGSLSITILLLSTWISLPFVTYKMVKKFLLSNDSYLVELKKLGYILLFMIITVSISNLGWIFPLNDLATPLNIFQTNNQVVVQDQWFIFNKFLYTNCFLTEWFPWVFIGYFLINLIIIFIIVKYKIKDQLFLDTLENKLKKFYYYFHMFDGFGPISCYSFIACYFMFNWQYMLIHIGYLLMILFICYCLISLILLSFYFIKNYHHDKSLKEPKRLMVISFTNHFSCKKLKSDFRATNISDVVITGIIFTIYMGFSYNFDFATSSLYNEFIYNDKMRSFAFWFQLILSGLMFNFISDNRSYNSSWSKLLISQATYSVVPGLQTGIVAWINPLFKPLSNFVNDMVYLLIH